MINGKVVAITGASSGIGKATALHLAEQGAKIVLGARGEHSLSALAAQITGDGGQAVYRSIDVSKRDHLSALIRLAQEEFGRLDVLSATQERCPLVPGTILPSMIGSRWLT